MNIGSQDKKKVITLGVLVGFYVLYLIYTNLLSGPSSPTPPRVARVESPSESPLDLSRAAPLPKRASVQRARSEEFVPVFREKRPEARPDVTRVDPTLHTELLAKVQAVEPAGGKRNLFDVGPPPPKPVELAKGPETKVVPTFRAYGPATPAPPQPKVEPPPPPINLKLYAVVTVRNTGKKTACFMDGDDILVAAEGDTLKRRYKVIAIGSKSVTVEDTESKRQQSVPLTEESGSV